MRVLITGGAGFIGSNIIGHHLKKGDEVCIVDDMRSGSRKNFEGYLSDKNFTFFNANILLWPELKDAIIWADRIYHMAAIVGMFNVLQDPISVMSVNIAGTERLLRAARAGLRKPRIILASSSEVYGASQNLESDLLEDMDLHISDNVSLRWNYAISKLANEAFGISYSRQFGEKVTAIRLFNTIGKNQLGRYGMVVPRFVKQAVLNEPITVFGDGNQRRCFCDVADTVDLIDLLAENDESIGKIVNVGSDRDISINDLANMVKKLAGSNSKIVHISNEQAYGVSFEEFYSRKPNLEMLHYYTGKTSRVELEITLQKLIENMRFELGITNSNFRFNMNRPENSIAIPRA